MPLDRHEAGAIALAERILNLLQQGKFTATYKYAVMIALINLCVANPEDASGPPTSVTTRQMAEEMIRLYWGQTRPFTPNNGLGRELRQTNIRDRQAKIVSLISEAREKALGSLKYAGTPDRLRRGLPHIYEKLTHDIEWVLIRYPLALLQNVGKESEPFLYLIGWDPDGITPGQIRAYQKGEKSVFNNNLVLLPGVAEKLVLLNGVLRPVLQREWAAMVDQFNGIGAVGLEEFLFGEDRSALVPVRGDLLELQSHRCFYCEGIITKDAQVDHFLPWARYPDNAIQNLVAAHDTCNNRKRDFLAASLHLEHWRARLQNEAAERQLREIAEKVGWVSHPVRTFNAVRHSYLALPEAFPLWLEGQKFERGEPRRIREVLGG